jgi:hypothetical protein
MERPPGEPQSPGAMKPTWKGVRRGGPRMLVALGLIVVTAAVSGFVGSLFSAGFAYRVLHRVADVFRPPPSAAHQIVNEYMQQTSTATFWREPPTLFPTSATYMEKHFAQFDPRVTHPYAHLPSQTYVPQVVQAAVVYAAHPIEVLGQISAFNVVSPPMPPDGRTEWLLQLQAITTPGQGLVLCRVTRPASYRPTAGSIARIEGVVMATAPSCLRELRTVLRGRPYCVSVP